MVVDDHRRIHHASKGKADLDVPFFPDVRQRLEVSGGVGLEHASLIEAVKAAHHRSHRRQRQRQILHQRCPNLLFCLRGRARGAGRGGVALSLVGRVTLQLGVDQAVVGADAGERADDRPTQVGVDLEAGENFDAVQQAAHDRKMLR